MSAKTPRTSGLDPLVAPATNGSGGLTDVHDNPLTETLIVPSDAGRYRDALTTVLLRIPTGYRKEISCGPGWYHVVAQLHKELCSIDVHYAVYSVGQCGNRLHYDAESQAQDPLVQRDFRDTITRAQQQSLGICPWSGKPLRNL